mgnify:CR=1 FL=1
MLDTNTTNTEIPEGQFALDTQSQHALGNLCDDLMELQVRRRALISDIGDHERRLKGLARRLMGWRFDAPDAERKRINEDAATAVKTMLAGKALDDIELVALADATGLSDEVSVRRESLSPLLAQRKAVERDMEMLASQTPGADFASATRGFAMRGLAVLIGEAGNLSDYPNPAKLWKRLGLAPYNGRAGSTWRTMKGGLKAEEWSEMGYSPSRLGQIYGVITVPLGNGNRDGKYRSLYLHEKARFIAEGKSERPMHAHLHAQRVMTKELVLDLWRAWRGMPPRVRESVMADDHHKGEAAA